MVNELSKAFIRRGADSRFATRWLVGDGIDIGRGNEWLDTYKTLLPLVRSVRSWGTQDGDAALMEGVADEAFDFVHSSHCLEHLEDPEVALGNWIRICRRDGHVIVTIPDEDRYEQGVFPSTYDPSHKWTFTINKERSWSAKSRNLVDLLNVFRDQIEILKIEVLDHGFIRGGPRSDQTMAGMSESAIEFVLRKRADARASGGAVGPHPRAARKVLVQRRIAMGDVIMITPVLRRLRAELGEHATIDVMTDHAKVLVGNPDINQARPMGDHSGYDRIIDLDGAYEARPDMHAIDAYMMAAFGDSDGANKETFLHREPVEDPPGLDWSRAITVNAGFSHRNRTMPRGFWTLLLNELVAADLMPVVLGQGMDCRWIDKKGVVDLTNRLSVGQSAYVIARSACFVSADTGAMHIAGTTLTPMVTIFTAVRAQYRMPWRKGEFAWHVTPLTPALDCIGCNGGSDCRRGDFACVEGVEAVSHVTVLEAIKRAVGPSPRTW